MFKYFEPNKIFSITSRAPKYVLLVFIIILCIGLTEALILSPEDYKQSHSVRIMYVHVPAAWISLGIFSIITFLSIAGYIFKLKNFFLISKSLAPSGFVFIYCSCYRIYLGKTNLGDLVGLGCKNYIDVNFGFILHIIFSCLENLR